MSRAATVEPSSAVASATARTRTESSAGPGREVSSWASAALATQHDARGVIATRTRRIDRRVAGYHLRRRGGKAARRQGGKAAGRQGRRSTDDRRQATVDRRRSEGDPALSPSSFPLPPCRL